MTYLGVSATFIDEITHDIPSQNWGPNEWAREFDTFQNCGIDTVVVIRTGYGKLLSTPSPALAHRSLPVHIDLVALFMELAETRGISVMLGLYDSGYHWYRDDWSREVELNVPYLHELYARFGDSTAFGGFYLPHETSDASLHVVEINRALAQEIRALTDHPILISPYFFGRTEFAHDHRSGVRTPEEHERIWNGIFNQYKGLVDICAFQDGSSELDMLEAYSAATFRAAADTGIHLWSNLETFDRDMPIKFPPIDWRKLAHKLDVVQPYVEKVITFEFSHFMSPNSEWGSARQLFRRYNEHVSRRIAEDA